MTRTITVCLDGANCLPLKPWIEVGGLSKLATLR